MKTVLACALLAAGANAFAHHRAGKEVLMGAQVYGRTIKLQVQSGGCTWKESFAVQKSLNVVENSLELTFIRVVPDNCEAYKPEGSIVTYSTSELQLRSGQAFRIKNEFIAN